MNKLLISGALCAAVILPQTALDGGYHYSHKAGVSLADWEADEKVCVDAAKETAKHPGVPTIYNPNPGNLAATAGASFAAGFMKGMMRRKAINHTYYNCLKAHGYVERELTKEEFKSVMALKGEARKAQNYEMISVENPAHPIMLEDAYD